jgi:hypothetical protein
MNKVRMPFERVPPKRNPRKSYEEYPVDYAPGRRDANEKSRVFPARFKGVCPCGEAWQSGDLVHYVSNGKDGVLAHEGCDGTEIKEAPAASDDAMGMSQTEIARIRRRLCTGCFCELPTSGKCTQCHV